MKFKILSALVFFFAVDLGALPVLSSNLVQHPSFSIKADYLALDLDYAPIESLRKELEAELGHTLLNRGEAHITVLKPQEFTAIRRKLAPDELLNIVHSEGLDIVPRCVGRGEALLQNRTEQTYFVVIETQSLKTIREKIAALFYARGGRRSQFQMAPYYPHITLGFTKRDLHDQDGVIKDEDSCPSKKLTAPTDYKGDRFSL